MERHLDALRARLQHMENPDILLTNDDGIDATGLHALYEALRPVGSVTVVAPAEDHSAAGRTLSSSVDVREHDLGYVVEGTPVDCVLAGLQSLCPGTDLVVAGCNQGANLGSAVLGRSGTVSTAVEAAFLDIPAIAVSMYIPAAAFNNGDPELDQAAYAAAVDAATHLVVEAGDTAVFERADYLNINAPIASRCTGEMVVTRPSELYRKTADRDDGTVTIRDPIWGAMESGSTADPAGTDRHAVVENQISVSPLSAPHTTADEPDLVRLAEEY
jgi:5''-nucleotidase (EC 3.1.3.5)/3''-nucleotidase (EC 3.1.3.6)/exopolyphosphatase (EC 3.6.1.11)